MIDLKEQVDEKLFYLLGSQRAFLPSADSFEKHRGLAAGFRSGKTFSLSVAALMLSCYVKDNFGFLGRAYGKDLQQTLYQTFMDEVCPSSLIIGKPRSIGQTGKELLIRCIDPRTGRLDGTSKIYFDYIVDRQEGKSHIAGMNLGWFGVSQAEEIDRADYLKLVGRLSRKVPRTFALVEFNQQGRNWLWEDFYSGGDYTFHPIHDAATYFKAVRKENRVGIVARSEENRISKGGFVADDYFDELRRTYPPMWCARFLDASFDDFSGKIYGDYNLNSVHNIVPFEYPSHWPWLVSIDPGGSAPWSLGVYRIDEDGNLIRIKEFYRGGLNPNIYFAWIRDNVPVNEARFIIDYENRPVMIQLQDELGITCEPAMKDIYAGIQQVASYMYPMADRSLPRWYKDTQPRSNYDKFEKRGAPRFYVVTDNCPDFCKEAESYIWDDKNPNMPKKGQDDHTLDDLRYAVVAHPAPARPLPVDRHAHLKSDPASYASARYQERLLERARASQKGIGDERYMDGDIGVGTSPEFIDEFCG